MSGTASVDEVERWFREREHPLEAELRLVRTMRLRGLEDIRARSGEIESVVGAWCAWRDS